MEGLCIIMERDVIGDCTMIDDCVWCTGMDWMKFHIEMMSLFAN